MVVLRVGVWCQSSWEGRQARVAGVVEPPYRVWVVVALRRLVGWTLWEQYGPVRRCRWVLRRRVAEGSFAAADRLAGEFMDSLVGVLSWSRRKVDLSQW